MSRPLAEGVTKDDGSYELNFPSVPETDVMIVVQAQRGTKMVDEVTNAVVDVPETFQLRAIPDAIAKGKADLHITPFTELVAAAAAKEGFSSEAISLANQSSKTLLGFDPRTVKPATIADSSTPEQQKMAVMLTALSKMANEQSLGCTQADLGARTSCVVKTLADNTTVKNVAPTQGNDALAKAILDVVKDPALNVGGKVPTSEFVTIIDNIEKNPTPVTPVDPTPSSVEAAKQMFNDIRNTAIKLFSSDPSAEGAVRLEAKKFEDAARNVQVPGNMVENGGSTLILATELYRDYPQTGIPWRTQNGDLAACSLFDASGARIQGAGASVASIRCRNQYDYSYDWSNLKDAQGNYTGYTSTESRYRQVFSVVPQSGDSFSYSTSIERESRSCTSTWSSIPPYSSSSCEDWKKEPLQLVAGSTTERVIHNGTFDVMWDTNPKTIRVADGSKLPPAFVPKTWNEKAHPGDFGSWNLVATLTTSGTGTEETKTAAMTGAVKVYKGGVLNNTLSLNPGSQLVVKSPYDDARHISAVTLNAHWQNASSRAEGIFSASLPQTDKSGQHVVPTQVAFTGALSNMVNGSWFKFLEGEVALGVEGFQAFDATKPPAQDNDFTGSVTVKGRVAAPSMASMDLVMSSTASAHELVHHKKGLGTGQYRTLDRFGKAVRVVNFTASNDGNTAVVTLEEALSGVKTHVTNQSYVTDVLKGTEVVGQVDRRSNFVTFKDGSYIGLAF